MSEERSEKHWIAREVVKVLIYFTGSLIFLGGIGTYIVSKITSIHLSNILIIVLVAGACYLCFAAGIAVTIKMETEFVKFVVRNWNKPSSKSKKKGIDIVGIMLIPLMRLLVVTVGLMLWPRWIIQYGWDTLREKVFYPKAKQPSKKELQETITRLQSEKEMDKEQAARLQAENEALKAEIAQKQATIKQSEETHHLPPAENANAAKSPAHARSHTRKLKAAEETRN